MLGGEDAGLLVPRDSTGSFHELDAGAGRPRFPIPECDEAHTQPLPARRRQGKQIGAKGFSLSCTRLLQFLGR